MNNKEKKTYKVLFSASVIALVWVSIYGIAQIWTFLSVSRVKTEIFNEVKDLPDTYTPKVVWLPDESLLRPMEDFTRAAIAKDFVRALYQRNLAILAKDTLLVQDYFTELSKTKIKGKIDNNKDFSVESIEVNHTLKMTYYSADGQIVAFTDHDSEHAQRIWSKDKLNMMFDKDTSSYNVIMILEDGYWRIHNMVRKKLEKLDSKKIKEKNNKDTLISRLKKAKGINYYPQDYPFKDFWINYDSAQVAKDIFLIKKLNFNAIRVFVNFEQFGKGNVIPEMLERLDHLMSVAEKNQVGVLLTLFDFNSDFSLFNFTATDRQLETILTKLKNKPSLLGYDLKNEPDIDYNYQDSMLVNQWLSFIVKKAKQYDEDTPMTIGWAAADYAGFLSENLDFVSFHFYKKADLLDKDIEVLKQKIKNKPLVISEFGISDYQSWVFPVGKSRNYALGQISAVSKKLNQANIPSFYWTLYDFEEVASDVAGRWPWQKEPQKHFGLISTQGTKKESADIITQNTEFKSSFFFDNITKFIYTYLFFGLVFVIIWIKKRVLIVLFLRLKVFLKNRFLFKSLSRKQ
jgi:hypothetical protein